MNCSGTKLLMGETQGRYDGHCHVFRADLPMIENRRYTPEYNATPEKLCHLLRAHKLDGALLIQPSFLGTDNQYLLNTLSELKTQTDLTFKGVVVLDPEVPPDASDIEYMNTVGIVGLRLNLYRSADAFDYDKWRVLLNQVESQGWHIELHCEATRLPTVLPQLISNHSNIVIDHFGLATSISTCEGLNTILKQPHEKLWIKLSAPYRLNQHLRVSQGSSLLESTGELYRIFADHVGTDRLVWGSDWPFTQFENQVTYSTLACNYTAL